MFVPPAKVTTVLPLPAGDEAITAPVASPPTKADPVVPDVAEVKSSGPARSAGADVESNKSSIPILLPIEGTPGKDVLIGTGGDDAIYGYDSNDVILAGAGDDLAFGGPDNDGILGGTGNDLLFGEAGNDWLEGGDGDDHLFGGSGDDLLYGGPGVDLLTGGEGSDTFMVGTQTEDDLMNHPTYGTVAPGLTVITDFQANEGDLLNVSPILDRPAFANLANPEDLAAFITLQPVGADTQMVVATPQGNSAVEALLLGVAPTDIPANALVFTPPPPPAMA